jgi:hypothetical protein
MLGSTWHLTQHNGQGLNHSIVHYRLQTSTETRYPLPLQLIAKPVELIEDLAFKQFQFLLVCKIRMVVFLLGKKWKREKQRFESLACASEFAFASATSLSCAAFQFSSYTNDNHIYPVKKERKKRKNQTNKQTKS